MTAKKTENSDEEKIAAIEKTTEESTPQPKRRRAKRSDNKTDAETTGVKKTAKTSAEKKKSNTARTKPHTISDADTPDGGRIPDDFVTDLLDLTKLFETHPEILKPIRDVFECHLVDPIDRKTFPRIVNAMSMLLGPAQTMVLMTGCHINSAGFFDDLRNEFADNESVLRTILVMQHLTAIYGNKMQKAYSLSSGTMDDDWHTIDVSTLRREGDNPAWLVDMEMSQYSGKVIHLKMTADSAYQLIDILMTELIDNVPAEQIDIDLQERCRKHCKDYYEKFYGKIKTKHEDEHPAGYA